MLTTAQRRYTPFVSGSNEASMASTDLQVQVVPQQECTLVRLIGEAHFDFDAGERYIREITLLKPRLVIIDASQLSFASSVGMNFLLNLRKTIRSAGATVRIAALQPLVAHALENAKLLHLFDTYPDIASAQAAH